MWQSSKAYPAAYCPPGRGFVVGYLYPRALPPVTQGSALQAPERMWGTIRSRIPSRGQVFIYVYRLGEDGYLKNEGNGMLSVWVLRARSYKTKAEV